MSVEIQDRRGEPRRPLPQWIAAILLLSGLWNGSAVQAAQHGLTGEDADRVATNTPVDHAVANDLFAALEQGDDEVGIRLSDNTLFNLSAAVVDTERLVAPVSTESSIRYSGSSTGAFATNSGYSPGGLALLGIGLGVLSFCGRRGRCAYARRHSGEHPALRRGKGPVA